MNPLDLSNIISIYSSSLPVLQYCPPFPTKAVSHFPTLPFISPV